MNKDIFEFVIYMIHACARKWGQSPAMVYKKMMNEKCIGEYLVPHYDILHTQGTEFVVKDIEEYMETKGEVVC